MDEEAEAANGDPFLSSEEYELCQTQLTRLALVVAAMPQLGRFLATAARAEALGPILDPTLYRRAEDNLEQIMAIARAALPLQQEARRHLAAARERSDRAIREHAAEARERKP